MNQFGFTWRAGPSHRFTQRGSRRDFLLPRERPHHDFRWRGRHGRRKFEIQDGTFAHLARAIAASFAFTAALTIHQLVWAVARRHPWMRTIPSIRWAALVLPAGLPNRPANGACLPHGRASYRDVPLAVAASLYEHGQPLIPRVSRALRDARDATQYAGIARF